MTWFLEKKISDNTSNKHLPTGKEKSNKCPQGMLTNKYKIKKGNVFQAIQAQKSDNALRPTTRFSDNSGSENEISDTLTPTPNRASFGTLFYYIVIVSGCFLGTRAMKISARDELPNTSWKFSVFGVVGNVEISSNLGGVQVVSSCKPRK